MTLRRIKTNYPDLPTVEVKIRRGRNIKYANIRVNECGEVSISVPRRLRSAQIDEIIQQRIEWISQNVTRMRAHMQSTEIDLERGDSVPYRGALIPTELVRNDQRKTSTAELAQGKLALTVPSGADVFNVLLRWYRNEARKIFRERTDYWAAHFGLRYGKISIREQKTRWGSCTHKGDLSYNWRLILAPDWVLDAIVVHELCHIDELNHSARFWSLLDERYPRHREASQWLRDNGNRLRVNPPTRDELALF